jgi:hypothetical protein
VRKKKDGGDVVAALYAPDWNNTAPEITEILKTARTRASKQLAHLTTGRIAGRSPEKDWDFDLLSLNLRAALRAFIEKADPAKLSTVCKDALSQI